MKASIDAEIDRIEQQIKSLDSERCTMEELVAQTEREVNQLRGVMEAG